MSKFEKYLFLKSKLKSLNSDEYPLEKVLGSYLATLIWHKTGIRLRFLIYCLRYDYVINNNSGILLTHLSERKSYLKLLNNFKLDNKPYITNLQKINLRKRSLFEIVMFIFQFFNNFKHYKELSYFQILGLNFLTTYALITINNLESREIKCSSFITLNSSYLFESFLSYYFRKRGIPTFSLQHAMYFKYKNDIPMDVINYENVCAENLICWGDYSINEIRNEIPNDVSLIKGKYPYPFKTYNKRPACKKVLLLLPRNVYKPEIKKLLEIIKLSKLKYIIRPHPTIHKYITKILNKIPNAKLDIKDELSETLSDYKYEFCISFNTTAMFEAALYKQKIIQYISNNDEFFIENVPSFKNLNEFENITSKDINRTIDTEFYFGI